MRNLKTIGTVVVGICLLGASQARAILITYDWEQSSSTLPGYISSGTLIYNTAGAGAVSSLTFTELNPGIPYVGTVNNFFGTATVLPPGLPNGDLQLSGSSTGTQNPGGAFIVGWLPNGTSSSATEQVVYDNTTITGAWVPVPEPATMIAGALLLLPFGVSTLRMRKTRTT
jgi:hypothetical protein